MDGKKGKKLHISRDRKFMILLRLVHFPIRNQNPPGLTLGSMLQEKIVVGKSLSRQNQAIELGRDNNHFTSLAPILSGERTIPLHTTSTTPVTAIPSRCPSTAASTSYQRTDRVRTRNFVSRHHLGCPEDDRRRLVSGKVSGFDKFKFEYANANLVVQPPLPTVPGLWPPIIQHGSNST